MNPLFFSTPSRDLAAWAWNSRGDRCSGPNLAIIGVGMMGREHLRVAALLGRARVRGIYDSNTDSIRLAQRECADQPKDVPRVYGSLEAACADTGVDGDIDDVLPQLIERLYSHGYIHTKDYFNEEIEEVFYYNDIIQDMWEEMGGTL